MAEGHDEGARHAAVVGGRAPTEHGSPNARVERDAVVRRRCRLAVARHHRHRRLDDGRRPRQEAERVHERHHCRVGRLAAAELAVVVVRQRQAETAARRPQVAARPARIGAAGEAGPRRQRHLERRSALEHQRCARRVQTRRDQRRVLHEDADDVVDGRPLRRVELPAAQHHFRSATNAAATIHVPESVARHTVKTVET